MTETPPPSHSDKSGAPDAVSAAEQITQCAQRIEAREPSLHAFCDLHLDAARREAARLDELPVRVRGPLHGIPLGVKEIFDVAGMRCAWGSPIHRERIPDADCEIVSRLRSAGAVVVGTTASTEYAMARAPATVNPFDAARSPGGSSSGSAAAIGAGLVPCALGSQTIGSGIRPAGYCGALAFKPSWGLWPLQGAMPLSHWLDHPVIMTANPEMLERLFDVLSPGEAVPPSRSLFSGQGCRDVMVIEPWFAEPLAPHVRRVIEETVSHLRHLKMRVENASISTEATGEEVCLRTILSHDMAQNHGDDYERSGSQMSPGLRNWIETGQTVTAAQYVDALAERSRFIDRMKTLLPDNGFALTAATIDIAPLRSEETGSRAPQRLWSLVGFPAMTLPAGAFAGLPIGVQLITLPGRDRELLKFGSCLYASLSGIGTQTSDQ